MVVFFFYKTLNSDSSAVVEKSFYSQQPNSSYMKFKGEILLPEEGYWQISRTNEADIITEIYMVPTTPLTHEQMGGRVAAVMDEQQSRKGQYLLRELFWPCREYAVEHNNTGPSSIKDLDAKKYKYVLDRIVKSPYDKTETGELEGPFTFLVPGVKFLFEEKRQYVKAADKKILAWELRPYVDDGKHWVLFTDGTCEQLAIDKQLMKKYKQVIRPVKIKQTEPEEKTPGTRSYTLAAVCKEKPKQSLTSLLENTYTGKTMELKWDMSKARPADENNPVDLTFVRTASWAPYALLSHSPAIMTWIATLDKEKSKDLFPRWSRSRRESLSIFDILGGRAAVRETLQLQVLDARAHGNKNNTVPLDSLEGVKIKAHPYEQMLKTNKYRGKDLPLADLVPHNRALVYMTNPKDILGFLDQGADFLDRLGTSFTGNGVDYGLDKKYPRRLGMDQQLLRRFLEAGVVKECALFFPDLFFIDGTDITVVCRLAKVDQAVALLKLTGIDQLPEKQVTTHESSSGFTVYRALWDDLLMISTSEKELEMVLQLKKAGGTGSLGKSHEFQYMLTQLPVGDSTWSYLYLSDPFIRRLVGAEVKIGQYRRIRARTDMEYLTACALLAKLDGITTPWSIKDLVEQKYVSPELLAGDYYFDTEHILQSKTYGSLSNMKTLSQVPITGVSKHEANAYKRYVDIYSDYWRRFFDPIALRLNETADGFLEAELFILPLVDNSFYNSIKTTLIKKEDKIPLKIPKLSADPVVMMSLNLADDAWKGILKGGFTFLTRYISLNPAIFEDFGPGLHLALHDADPIIALGSGDILGVFSADMLGAGMNAGMGGGMFSFPVLFSILTRPCTLIIETQNPRNTLNYLRQAIPGIRSERWNRDLMVRAHQVEDLDRWVFSFVIGGFFKLRFSIELQDEFVLIRNIPWSHDEKIVTVDKTGLNSAAILTFPDACDVQLPGLFEAHQDRALFTAFQGAGYLYPLLACGYASMEDAAEKHEALFGFTPKHPDNGHFVWENFDVTSTMYGSVYRQRQPAYKKGDGDFGVLKGFRYLGVSMQFEDTGLRTRFRWKITK